MHAGEIAPPMGKARTVDGVGSRPTAERIPSDAWVVRVIGFGGAESATRSPALNRFFRLSATVPGFGEYVRHADLHIR
ncbi:hypothetical protein, partial [Bifidobacterium choerinum]|uniref:hypothetical protein n=1 Tax=Bifidobacterium choerinum TaxID=35760 RepID=UPI0019D3D61B